MKNNLYDMIDNTKKNKLNKYWIKIDQLSWLDIWSKIKINK